MKNLNIVFVVLVFGFSSVSFAGGITGGTVRNTTDEQREQTRESSTHKDMSEKNSRRMIKVLEKIPTVGTYKKLIKGMAWTAKKQREAGGVTMTGGTAKEGE